MTDDIPNQTLALLREMRTELRDFRAETHREIHVLDAKVNAIAQTQVSVLARLDKIERDLGEFKNHIGVIAIAVDEHSTRMQRVEDILGQPRHNA
jgi:hypothetical protein